MNMIYPERESKTIEFKSTLPSFNNLIKTCVAFANGVGGQLIIGVEHESRQVAGIDDAIRDTVYESFANALYDSTQPNLIPQIYEKALDRESVLIIKVFPTHRKPCFIKSKGIPEGVYCRVGAHTRKASEEHMQELMSDAHHKFYDVETLAIDANVFDQGLLKNFYGSNKITDHRLLNDRILGYAPGNQELLQPTVAGLLLFSNKPHDYLPEAHIICTQFKGIEGRDIIRTEEVTGDLTTQADISIKLINQWMSRGYRLVGAKMLPIELIPEVAIREAINNALLHRKYNIHGAIKIAIYDDRLELFSPGQLPGLVDINKLGDGTTYLRNPNLVRLARHMGLIEKLGSGIKLIFSSCVKAGLKKPEFFENGDSVKVVFKLQPIRDATKNIQASIKALFKFKEEITVADISASLDVSRNTSTRYANRLITQGYLIRTGRGPAVRFRWIKSEQ